MNNFFAALAKCPQQIVRLTKNGIKLMSKNSNLVLTMISAAGVLTTTYVAIKGTIKAVKLCEEKQVHGTKEVVKTVWKCYIPTIGMVILTTTAILCNGKINAKRLAVLTSAYSGSVETIKKLEEKMTEQIGPKKTEKARDEAEIAAAKEHLPERKEDVIISGDGRGKQLFYLRPTGQWFYSDYNGIELAELKINKAIEELTRESWGETLPVSEVQEALGLAVTDMGEYMGWDLDQFRGNVGLSLIISSDWMDLPWGKEIVGVIRFSHWPDNL